MDDPPWTSETIDQCTERRPHPSANLHWEFLWTKMANFINASCWVMLPLKQVCSLGKDFHLSPVAVKEEVNCWPQVIVDHTWFRVNEHTVVELLLSEVMQFRGALSQVLWLLHHANPSHGPIYMAKYDISNGFYQMFLDPEDSLKLSVLMPRYEGEPQHIAIPLSTMMGWVSSPPTCCTASETMASLANASLYKHTVQLHHMEDATSLYNSWEPSQPIYLGEEPSSLNEHGPLAAPSLLADDQTPALGEEPPSSNNHGPLTTLSLMADDQTPALGEELSSSNDCDGQQPYPSPTVTTTATRRWYPSANSFGASCTHFPSIATLTPLADPTMLPPMTSPPNCIALLPPSTSSLTFPLTRLKPTASALGVPLHSLFQAFTKLPSMPGMLEVQLYLSLSLDPTKLPHICLCTCHASSHARL